METERLVLRNWLKRDLKPFASMNSDPVVMEFFPKMLSEDESNAMAANIQNHLDREGWGLWAVERKDCGKFIGFTGLSVPKVILPFSPCVEIGWRLAKEHWGKGFASEAARAVLKFAFSEIQLEEVVSFTAKINLRSQAVMKRIGMQNTDFDFKHPNVPPESILCHHVLFKAFRTLLSS
ncbi:MAG: N-acetyltransferase [Erysipelotrichia bacterium]|nr:N-acetyltransferase [Erysipelotrichia bacterium]